MIAASLLLHGALYAAVHRMPKRTERKDQTVSFEIVQPAPKPPPPAPPPKPVEEARPEPKPAPKPVKLARAMTPRAPPPPNTPPPPPNAPPPPQAAPAKPPVIRVGISLASTTTSGGFAVGVGNTLYGKAEEKAADPTEVRPYSATEVRKAPYVPPTRVSQLPRLLEQPKPPYPEEARKAGVEGQVVLLLKIDETGRVVSVKALSGPGYGMEEVAAKAARQFRFAPATVDGEPVGTEIRFTYTFVLE